jgi:hypothetical protein
VRRYFPIILSILIVFISFGVVYSIKNSSFEAKDSSSKKNYENRDIGSFIKSKTSVRFPIFLSKLKIPQPIAIDLSQQHYKGLAFLFGRGLRRAVHLKSWERFDYFGSYALDREGNIYLTPMPFISVKPYTFNLQKNIYKLDSRSGKLSIWLTIDEVNATSNNPFGIISVAYDGDSNSLWISAIDRSDYFHSRGVIYQIDIASKEIVQKIESIDALTIKLVETTKGKYLLAGLAKDNSLVALEIKDGRLSSKQIKLFETPNIEEHIRKIRVAGEKHLKVETIPFSYTLIAETGERSIRRKYNFYYEKDSWVDKY